MTLAGSVVFYILVVLFGAPLLRCVYVPLLHVYRPADSMQSFLTHLRNEPASVPLDGVTSSVCPRTTCFWFRQSLAGVEVDVGSSLCRAFVRGLGLPVPIILAHARMLPQPAHTR